MKKEKNLLYYLILSITGAIILLIITFFSTPHIIDTNSKLFVGIIFNLSCVFGVSLALRPGWYKKNSKHQNGDLKDKKIKMHKIKFRGHHPNCRKFNNHIINTKKKVYCAGCLGLALGSIISILLMSIYIFILDKLQSIFYLSLPIGFIMIIIIYSEITLSIRKPIIHVISNIFLVISFLIIVISILEITGNIIYGLIGVLLSFLWLDTRVQLSILQHTFICKDCNKFCKIY